MNLLLIAMIFLSVLYLWSSAYGRRVRARTARIRNVHRPDAIIRYMNMRGKRYIWKITIESVQPRGKDWVVTAWCYEKNEFLTIYASRMYEYFDLNIYEDIKNVPAYFTDRFGDKQQHKSV